MNFLAAFGGVPTVQTRKALLLLDFQNDFVRPSGALYVPNTADFLDSLPQLASAFRSTGTVFWIQSYYESRRELVDAYEQELVVLGRGGEDHSKKHKSYTGNDSKDEEAFLSAESARCGDSHSPGGQLPAPIVAAFDSQHDILTTKSDYSALRNDRLVLTLRSQLITEIYICGSLSNISVYATVLDAASLGFSVTLVEDCLGFRHFERHEEAMRRMADVFGANGITSEELIQELDWQETDRIAEKGGSKPRPARSTGIEDVLDNFDFQATDSREPDGVKGEEEEEGEEEDRPGLKVARAKDRYGPPPGHTDKKVRTRVRRARRPDEKPETSSRSDARRVRRSKPSQDLRGPGDQIGEGDSRIVYDLDLPSDVFEKVRREVAWQKMYHMSGQVPRLVAVQGRAQGDGSIPIYRHPADESPRLHPFTETVDLVRVIVEQILGHPLNHVLIQLYRDGQDRISEHSDKTLDIARDSYICNVSLGAQRVMVLRTKAAEGDSTRQSQRIPLPHESLFVLGQKTNMRWLHGIRPDKRPESEKSVEERAYGGERISLTFRHIGTFLNPVGDTIWGQGAVSKEQGQARPVIHGDAAETQRLIHAFGQENHVTEFDWDGVYGGGFDVVNFVTASTAQVIPGDDPVANLRVRLCLSESSLRYDMVTAEQASVEPSGERPVYIGTDGTIIAGDVEIMDHFAQQAHLEAPHPGIDRLQGGAHLAKIEELLTYWRQHRDRAYALDVLRTWENALDGKHYLGGSDFTIDDCSLWSVLRDIVQIRGKLPSRFSNIRHYYNRVEKRGLVQAVLEEV